MNKCDEIIQKVRSFAKKVTVVRDNKVVLLGNAIVVNVVQNDSATKSNCTPNMSVDQQIEVNPPASNFINSAFKPLKKFFVSER